MKMDTLMGDSDENYKILGIGSYGYVVTPGIGISLDEDERRMKKNQVSKLFFEDIEARTERLNANRVANDIDPHNEFTCYVINYGQIPVDKAEKILQNAYENESLQTTQKNINSIPKCINPTVSFITYNCGGETIESYFRKRPRSIFFEDILPGLLNLIKGVQKIHQAGLAHFDIKPMNILIDENDNHKIRLIDFGGLVSHSNFVTRLEPSIVDSPYCYYPPEIILLSFASKCICEVLQEIQESGNIDGIGNIKHMKYNAINQDTLPSQGSQGSQDTLPTLPSQGTQGSQGTLPTLPIQGIIPTQGTQGSQNIQNMQMRKIRIRMRMKMNKIRFIQRLNRQYKRFGLSLNKEDENRLYAQFIDILTHVASVHGSSIPKSKTSEGECEGEEKEKEECISATYHCLHKLFSNVEKEEDDSFSYPAYFDSFSLGISIQQIYYDALMAGRVKDTIFCEEHIMPIAIAMSNVYLNERYSINQAVSACENVARLVEEKKKSEKNQSTSQNEIVNEEEEEKSLDETMIDVEEEEEEEEQEQIDDINNIQNKKDQKWNFPIFPIFRCFPIE